MASLRAYGFDDVWEAAYAGLGIPLHQAARVVSEQRGFYQVVCNAGTLRATMAGAMRQRAGSEPAARMAVGDWVALAATSPPRIERMLPRRSVIARKEAGRARREQIMASNVDVAFLVCAVGEVNARKLERFISIATQGNVRPVVVLNKLDLADDAAAAIDALRQQLHGVELCPAYGCQTQGAQGLVAFLSPGRTCVFLGGSGVGKTTLVNRLMGTDTFQTGAVMEDGRRGRHTTTSRTLVALPQGAILMDTPGLREVGLLGAEQGVAESFADITELTHQCRFTDCCHRQEPGCAILVALDDNTLSRERFDAWQTLLQELRGGPTHHAAPTRTRRR